MDSIVPDLNPRFENIDKARLLSMCPLFSGLSQWELKSISQLMRLVEFKRDEIVYGEGAAAESFFVVVSGRFEASIAGPEKRKVLAYLRRGDYFGETSLLTQEPHSATIRALSDSILLALTKENFKRLIEHNAAVSFELSRLLSGRLRGTDERSRLVSKCDVISVYSCQRQVGRTEFSINLAAALFRETGQRTILIDMSPSGAEITSKLHMAKKVPITRFQNIEHESSEALGEHLVKHPVGFEVLNVAHETSVAGTEQVVSPLLNNLANDFRFIVIDLPKFMDETVMKAMSQSDSIFIVTNSHVNNVTEAQDFIRQVESDLPVKEDRLSVVINEVIFGIRTTSKTKKELFGRHFCYSLPSTSQLSEKEELHNIPFVVEEPEADYSRVIHHIARRISGNLVGLALGSGAALGLAHIGVLKVLEREGIPIDIISGSSIGSLIGSLYAVTQNAAAVEEAALEINSALRVMRLMDFTLLPLRGVVGGQRVMKHFKSHLGTKTFDDCRIPLKITGANLTTHEIEILDTGFIADAVRTSIAIPAIFKPTVRSGEVIVDGGILSPLPIRALRDAGADKIIAVNVFPTSRDIMEKRILKEEIAELEEKTIQQKNWFIRSVYRFRKYFLRRFFPNIFDILMNTIQTMEHQIAEVQGEEADVLLRPVVPNASWVEFYKPKQFIERGEEEALRAIPRIKELVSQRNV